jgi:transcriptional regulator with XRE-family HTH domain
MSLVSENIRFLRKQHGYTQEKLANKIGIKRSLLGAYEEARAEPRSEYLHSMALIFGVSIEALRTEDFTNMGGQELKEKASNVNGGAGFTSSYQPRSQASIFDMPASRASQTGIPARQPVQQPSIFQRPRQPISEEYLEGKKLRMLSVTVDQKNRENIEYISQKDNNDYISRFGDPEYLESLPRFQLPMLPEGELYRAFEAGKDTFTGMGPGGVVVGRYVRNWYSLKDQQVYIVVTRSKGIVCRKIANQIQEKGCLLLLPDTASFKATEVAVEDVLEIWEAKAFISMYLPEGDMSLHKLTDMVMNLQQEVLRLKQNG